MVAACTTHPDVGQAMIVFKFAVGAARHHNGSLPVAEFIHWVKYEGAFKEIDWVGVDGAGASGPATT